MPANIRFHFSGPTHTHAQPVRPGLRGVTSVHASPSKNSIQSQWTVEMLTRAREDTVSADKHWCPLLLCAGVCGSVMWLMRAVSNLWYLNSLPQGRQGPERSDIRLRASAGLIERYVSVSVILGGSLYSICAALILVLLSLYTPVAGYYLLRI